MAHLFSVAVLSLYITWRAYQTMAGKLVRPFEEIVWDVSRMLIIMIFVTNAGAISIWFRMPSPACGTDSAATRRSGRGWIPSGKSSSTWEKLYSYDDSTYVALKGTLAQFLVWAGVMLLVGITAIINLIAELVMLLMLATAPIFIYCLMWSWFRDMFSNWLRIILGCILTSLFSGIALTVVMDYLDYILAGATKASDANYLTLAVQVFLGTAGAAAVMVLTYKLAEALAGASAQGAAQALAASGVGSARQSASSAAGAVGDKASQNLNSTGSATASSASTASRATGDARSRSRAAVQRMQERYQR
ncbi:conjugal transfer protein (plasmid) [Edwardsiella piscicida]|nr:type IV secretion system protein [Edwardsiella piscicida]QHR96918.1 conjugal transfer protein [Edwardsiella piscicida]